MIRQFGFFGTNGDAIPTPWTTSFGGGTGTNSINANRMKLLTPAVGAYLASARADLALQCWDGEVRCRVTPSQVWSTEGFMRIGFGDQWNNATQNGFTNGFSFSIGAGASPSLNVGTMVAGTETNPVSITPTLSGSSAYWFRWRKLGVGLFLKYWQDGTVEPSAWSVATAATTFPTADLHLMIGDNTGNAASAVGFEVDMFTIDDLQPVKSRTTFRRF